MPGFVPGVSCGQPEFTQGCDAVAMGRTTFLPALGAPRWPWPGLQVYVLTSRPLPASTPGHVIAAYDGPAALAGQLRSCGSDGDVHLVGGPRTIRAFRELGRLEIIILPILLGGGTPLSLPGTRPCRWSCSERTGSSPTPRPSSSKPWPPPPQPPEARSPTHPRHVRTGAIPASGTDRRCARMT